MKKIVKELPFKGPGLRGSYVKIVLLRVQRTMCGQNTTILILKPENEHTRKTRYVKSLLANTHGHLKLQIRKSIPALYSKRMKCNPAKGLKRVESAMITRRELTH